MKKEQFRYNPNTLQYEKIEVSLQSRLLKFGLFAAVLFIYSLGFYFAVKSTQYSAEDLADMNEKFKLMNYQLDQMGNALDNIHERDQAIYRQVLEMNPTDEGVWRGGRGGNDKFEDIRHLSNAELMIATANKLDKLKRQMSVSAKSQDDVIKQAKDKEKMLSSIPSIRPIRKLKKKIQHLSGFGYRTHPVFKRRKMHTGIDFGARTGEPIYATGDGKVVRVEYKRTGYGKNVVIDHGYGYKTLYGHMSKVKVKVGQKVSRGEVIGLVGSTGTSTSPHVHYEVIYKGSKINPLPFCLDGFSPEEYKAFVAAATAENQAMSIE